MGSVFANMKVHRNTGTITKMSFESCNTPMVKWTKKQSDRVETVLGLQFEDGVFMSSLLLHCSYDLE